MAKPSQPPPAENTMQLAEILSDLVSLRVCDPSAALALVSARPPKSSSTTQTIKDEDDNDPDIQRAKDLVELHYSLREAHKRGELARGLEEARQGVWRAVGV
ncbi:hypothetical protein K491DRAFT_709471 [Lophiostoma macrostomum CBS 122681]|uniref:Uncharacterized protein n=1 Tax=Lophiostoma macrostomum CBS 122681 TaxID=1314788 RepID=A0A6A6TVA9_9PLEO|nr:hypothetical protein K491DRAFT_709471 [Lophiostoma macrostomum CBS 122681]